jgi:hypothetical protein
VLAQAEEGKGLGTLLVIILLTQKLGSIVKCLNNAVKDAARHFVVASPSLTAPFKRRCSEKWRAPVPAGSAFAL